MKIFKIYTAGKMYGLSFEEQMGWRREIEKELAAATSAAFKFIHPPLYFGYGFQEHKSENEVKQWEINQIRDSDIVIVNLEGVNDSVGTHFELSAADAVNSFGGKHIHVIGIGKPNEKVHPWIELSLLRHEEDYKKAAEYIADYLLV